ncbi:MAG: NADH-quinone oxidoreductase subunit K [Omnitrophica bacterium RIFCSPLOWO2_02_FULL_45_16]|nr:MAG: NADH-quinone oxidoreductase subunit K [Omnitrophica bacterium RIFCSPHIGHO2_02_FULL_46_20]OGW92659.1 MAG: NADH-quinone oxidoreductase subunit K [Omnitrophica bacterium RIFCSPLOWO2_12_FULL_45_13]OGW93041.1 MAG: NADH-quinone oxidoreductase subunit K [Omnitrophica bacterium RIFCSPLOWO2_01_FULL_45_24]OGX00088.1 MAG: NADH-quinone oxidoreductase subunit K [Omnitrophica bacterium RIFCSPLOWO2_02_FULL_45_16]
MIPQSHFLILSALLFSIGVFGILTRKNAIGILMSIELILNAANINLITFGKFLGSPDGLGQIFALFVIAIAAASAVVGLGLVISIYRNAKTILVNKLNLMKW